MCVNILQNSSNPFVNFRFKDQKPRSTDVKNLH